MIMGVCKGVPAARLGNCFNSFVRFLSFTELSPSSISESSYAPTSAPKDLIAFLISAKEVLNSFVPEFVRVTFPKANSLSSSLCQSALSIPTTL